MGKKQEYQSRQMDCPFSGCTVRILLPEGETPRKGPDSMRVVLGLCGEISIDSPTLPIRWPGCERNECHGLVWLTPTGQNPPDDLSFFRTTTEEELPPGPHFLPPYPGVRRHSKVYATQGPFSGTSNDN